MPGRPGISRSKSTSAAKAGFAGLSPRWQQAATAAFRAGSQAAMQPGKWDQKKGARIATAALGAAALDAFSNKKKDGGERSKGSNRGKSGGVQALGGALGNLLLSQLSAKKR